MSKSLLIVVVIAGLALVLGLGGCSAYNGLVTLDQGVEAQWSQVENAYQRRADLIPNLVKTVQGAADFEKSTLTEITEARASVGKIQLNGVPDAAQLEQYEAAQGSLGRALGRLMVIVEKYPELKANANFSALQAQLEGTENRIAVERGRFNETVQAYNTRIRSIPAVFFAGALGFHPRAYFKSTAGAETPPEVNFDFGNKPADGE